MAGLGEPLDHLGRIGRSIEQQAADHSRLLERPTEARAVRTARCAEPRTGAPAATGPRSAETSAPLPGDPRTAPATESRAAEATGAESTKFSCTEHVKCPFSWRCPPDGDTTLNQQAT